MPIETTCESCKSQPITNLDGIETGDTYKICNSCRERLDNRALRPLEFFNLVAIHGETHELHDDFYDYDTGEAIQPDVKVDNPEEFPFPSLEEIRNNLHYLVDFACVEYFTSDKTIELIQTFDKGKVLDYLNNKVNYNREINYKCYEIASKVLNGFAESWIRDQWINRKPGELAIFAEALAACLPPDEAFEIITTELEALEGDAFNQESLVLCYLRSSKTLDWIDKNQSKIINISQNWGTIAAASQFNWTRAEKWLSLGRPLSLIALDALLYYYSGRSKPNWPGFLQKNPPLLIDFPEHSIITNAVTQYLKTDKAPRPQSIGLQIIKNLSDSGNMKGN